MSINEMNYCEQAESVIQKLGRPDSRDPGKLVFEITTSKIRNLLSMVNQIYNDVVLSEGDVLAPAYAERITYLRVRMVYEAGREKSVKDFFEKSGLLAELGKIGGLKKNFMLFCRYFEALVAYHRYHGGKD